MTSRSARVGHGAQKVPHVQGDLHPCDREPVKTATDY
jgi:hypothetical protein